MPGGDGTGPGGFGPMTGRAAGYCAGYPVPGYMNPIPGRGFGGGGRGFGGGRRGAWGGGGRGRRNWYWATGMPGWMRASYGMPAWGMPAGAPYAHGAPYDAYGPAAATPAYGAPYGFGAPVTKQQELETLQGQAEYFEDALDGIKSRIQELEQAVQKKE